MKSLLYSKFANNKSETYECKEISWFSPTPFRLYLKGEKVSVKTLLVRLYFFFITGGKTRIYYYFSNGQVVHTSVVMPKCFKFPYMESGSYTIGPCYTKESHRGQGIYPKILSYILADKKYINSKIYMVVNDSNKASIRGIEKAGFQRCGSIRKSKLLKRYHREEITHDT